MGCASSQEDKEQAKRTTASKTKGRKQGKGEKATAQLGKPPRAAHLARVPSHKPAKSLILGTVQKDAAAADADATRPPVEIPLEDILPSYAAPEDVVEPNASHRAPTAAEEGKSHEREGKEGATEEGKKQTVTSKDSWQLRELTHADVMRITENFSQVVGEGDLGTLYEGQWDFGNWEEHSEVAVKVLKKGGTQDINTWKGEVQTLSKLRHPNLVRLKGFCCERDRILVFDRIGTGSLAPMIHDPGEGGGPKDHKGVVSFRRRVKALQGAAEALLYLHTEHRMVFRDFTTHDILVDKDFNTRLPLRLSDFGLDRPETYEGADFLAPEYVVKGRVTEKCDVYSLGVVIIEVLTGQKASTCPEKGVPLVDWVLRRSDPKDESVKEGWRAVVDGRLGGVYSDKAVRILLAAARVAVSEDAPSRPAMGKVVQAVKLAYKHSVLESYTRQQSRKKQPAEED